MDQSRRGRSAGRTLLDLALLVCILYVGKLVVVPAVAASETKASLRIMRNEAREVYEAFERFYDRNNFYPNAYTDPGLDLHTLDPLRKRGYYRGHITAMLKDRRVDAYDSPDDKGLNREFWVEMTLERDPSIRILIAKSDDAPMGGGQWRDGVFIYRKGSLEPL